LGPAMASELNISTAARAIATTFKSLFTTRPPSKCQIPFLAFPDTRNLSNLTCYIQKTRKFEKSSVQS
jgi:hypothetical protein